MPILVSPACSLKILLIKKLNVVTELKTIGMKIILTLTSVYLVLFNSLTGVWTSFKKLVPFSLKLNDTMNKWFTALFTALASFIGSILNNK